MTLLRYTAAALLVAGAIILAGYMGKRPNQARNRDIGVKWCLEESGHLGVETDQGCVRWDRYRAP